MSEPDLTTPGGMISSQREQRGMSIADLSESTKIPAPVLEAIERNEFHKVSGALYIKSFLRTCATDLGLEEDEVLAKYAQFSGEFESGTALGENKWREEDVQISRIGLPWRLIGIGGAVLAGLSLIVILSVRGCRGEPEPSQNEPTAGASTTENSTTKTVAVDAESSVEGASEQIRVVVAQSVPQKVGSFSATDSLSRSFQSTAPRQIEKIEKAAKKQSDTPIAAPTNNSIRPVSAVTEAVVGDKMVEFSGNESRNVVLRILCQNQVKIEVKRDAERSFSAVLWPANEDVIPSLPPDNIVAGHLYRVTGGFVVYWGAEDHFSLKLSSTQGVEVSLNAVQRDVARLKPGGELVLDIHGN